MLKRTWITLLCLILITSMLLVSCDNGKTPDDDTSGSEEVTTQLDTSKVVQLLKNSKLTYQKIIYPSGISEKLMSEITKLREDLYDLTGKRYMALSDANPSNQPIKGTNEIVIGDALRLEAQDVLATLNYRDSAIVFTENNILIAGYQDSVLTTAIRAFRDILKDADNIEKNGKDVSLKWAGDIYTRYDSYAETTVNIGGVDLKEYSIVYSNNESKNLADDLRRMIGRTYGYVLPMYKDSTKTTEYEILIGNVDRTECKKFYDGTSALDTLDYSVSLEGKKLVFAAVHGYTCSKAMDKFKEAIKDSNKLTTLLSAGKQSVAPNIPATVGYRIMQYNVMNPDWYWDLPINLSGPDVPAADQQREYASILVDLYNPDILLLNERFRVWNTYTNQLASSGKYKEISPIPSGHDTNCTPILYNSAKFTEVASGVFDYCRTSLKDTSEDFSGLRLMTWVILKEVGNTGNEKSILVCNMHLHAVGNDAENQYIRETQARYIVEEVKRILTEYPCENVVLGGDMNATMLAENSKAYTILLNGLGLKDGLNNNTGLIDHLGYKGMTVNQYGRDTSELALYASDHNPIYIDVTLK